MTKDTLIKQSRACCEFRSDKDQWIRNERSRLALFLDDPQKIESTISAKVAKFMQPKTMEQVIAEIRTMTSFEEQAEDLWIERAGMKKPK